MSVDNILDWENVLIISKLCDLILVMKDGEIDEFNMFDSYANAWTRWWWLIKWKTTIIARIIKYDKTILEYFQKLLPQQAL